MVPRQRKPGQTGGGSGYFTNRGKSVSRGGSPSRGGGGTGRKPPGGCVLLIAFTLGTVSLLGYGIFQWLA